MPHPHRAEASNGAFGKRIAVQVAPRRLAVRAPAVKRLRLLAKDAVIRRCESDREEEQPTSRFRFDSHHDSALSVVGHRYGIAGRVVLRYALRVTKPTDVT